MSRIRVGIVGASPERGWAVRAHVPALRALPDYEITAVSTTREDSAREAARRFGAAHAFTDPRALAAHPEVDLVAVTVKVPHHAELVEAAVDAGTHVLCEWPLARTTDEARDLLDRARAAGVRHALGLQGRFSPVVAYARDLLADGAVGRVVSVNVHSTTGKGAGGMLPSSWAYTAGRANAAGLLEVMGGHTLDLVEHLLGGVGALSATLAVQREQYVIEESGETIEADAPNQLALSATMTSGAVLSMHLHDGKVTEPGARIEISGTEGDLALVSRGAHAQISELRLHGTAGGTWKELPVPEEYVRVPGVTGDARNVAELYAALAADLRTGGERVPDFAHGLRLHGLLDAVRRSAETGTRQTVTPA
ncbi:Gfo/Idh/MocA family oxidoreductase [Microbispora sp. SCL1-1]|uniref:Gfo/Idh/MocA family protein n=1 Tax=unclassified Microbispora TaxID=2614687 RepID=UPI00115804B5|nr:MULTISPECIES: Gfo/Idh/MocA family oxidoreductase [unclassified Microbispora]NJP23668.1 Gfo/Idh/MocA family oxidoreductase [Microbispora sp. CL1-1]TQS15881.1 Gfo/Idh/MocA family oxidoreductase [Microbispora sp. SCL1-1]